MMDARLSPKGYTWDGQSLRVQFKSERVPSPIETPAYRTVIRRKVSTPASGSKVQHDMKDNIKPTSKPDMKSDTKIDIKQQYAKIEWLLENGSIFLALKQRYIKSDDLTKWVVGRAVSNNSIIALRALWMVKCCNSTCVTDQYPALKLSWDELQDQDFLLDLHMPVYRKMFDFCVNPNLKVAIAASRNYEMVPGVEVAIVLNWLACGFGPIDTDEYRTSTLIDSLDEAISNLHNDDWMYYFSAINPFDRKECKRLRAWMDERSTRTSTTTAVKDGAQSAHDGQAIELLLRYDLMPMIPEELVNGQSRNPIGSLLERCRQLKNASEQSHSYWVHCAHPEYLSIMERLKKGGWLARMDLLSPRDLELAFDLFPPLFTNASPSDCSPTKLEETDLFKAIFKAQDDLVSAGASSYCDVMTGLKQGLKFRSSTLKSDDPRFAQIGYLLHNDAPQSWRTYLTLDRGVVNEDKYFNVEDTLGEPIDQYPSVDCLIVKGPPSGKSWIITRPEWDYVLSKRCNPYTRMPMSPTVMRTLQWKLEVLEINNIPKPAVPIRQHEEQILAATKSIVTQDGVAKLPWDQ